MPAAIYFQHEGFTTAGPKLMGRNAAGESFLRAVAEEAGDGPVWALVDGPHDAQAFAAETARWSATATPRAIPAADLLRLAEVGTLFAGDPLIAAHAWHRAAFGARSWSLCGITHTTASHAAMGAITDMVSGAVEEWDALICTSVAVKSNVERLIEAQRDHLRSRLGAVRFPAPLLPVIPLGVHARDFAALSDRRGPARDAVGLGKDDIAVAFVGRLSAHAKANPIAFYLALERAAATVPGEVVLIEYGRFANDAVASAFAEASAVLCPSIRRIVLDGRDPILRETTLAAADIFCSLADNVQEAFGITPVEAMAAGLPVVVTDWDGYRDTVRDGEDGFRIPTTMPRDGLGQDLAVRYARKLDSYDRYIGYASAVTAVDIDAAAGAFARLFSSAELRRTMGASGQRRVRELFDWPVVLRAYESLWTEQSAIRSAAPERPPCLPPARPDPFAAFGGYPSEVLDEDTLLELTYPDSSSAIAAMSERGRLKVIDFARAILSGEADLHAIVERTASGPRTAGELVAELRPERRLRALRSLGWLLKIGILRRPR